MFKKIKGMMMDGPEFKAEFKWSSDQFGIELWRFCLCFRAWGLGNGLTGPFGGGWFTKFGFSMSNPLKFYKSFDLVLDLLVVQIHFVYSTRVKK